MHHLKLSLTGLFLLITLSATYASYETRITVAQDGSGDFTSIQEAINNTKSFPDKRITIYLKNGIYEEKVEVPAFNTHLSIIGEDPEKTIISWNDHFKKIDKGRNSTFFTYTFKVEANDFYAENLTIKNTAGPVGQAVALHLTGDRIAFHNCRILGNQDTFYSAGEKNRNYFSECYIEGTTDFIFGEAVVLFEHCTIHSLADSYITAASTPEGNQYGFVFSGCKLTAAPEVTEVYLGRPWRNYANVAFIRCEMGSHILPEGWANWSGTSRTETAIYREFRNSGPGADITKRVNWSNQLTKEEAAKFSKENILSVPHQAPVSVSAWTSQNR
jgi:pectinesterase